jgi:hypothetical protein
MLLERASKEGDTPVNEIENSSAGSRVLKTQTKELKRERDLTGESESGKIS